MAARASRTRSAVGALALAILLASCATGADVEDETVGANPTASPSPSAEPTPEPTTFTTQNGTASFAVPAGWTVEDTSELDPVSNHGGPVWLNRVALVDADGTPRAHYGDGYADDVGAAVERLVVQSLPMGDGLHAAAWWSTAGEGDVWHVEAAVVADLDAPSRTVVPEGFDRLHAFTADLAVVPECASVIDEASATACLEAPGTTEALELLATLELEALPWDAMPEGVDPQTEVPWVDYVSADGALAFSHPASWSILTHDPGSGAVGDTFVTLVTPDGYQALDIRLSSWVPEPSRCDATATDPYWTPIEVLSGEPVAPFVDPAIAPSSPLQLATFTFGGDGNDGTSGAAILRADHLALGCFDPRLPIADGSLEVTTPWGTDMEGLIYDLYPGGAGFVGSYEHDVMLEVARSVTVTL